MTRGVDGFGPKVVWRLELMRAYLLVMLQRLMLTVSTTNPPDSLRRRVTWSLMRIMAPKWSKVVLVM